MSWEFLDEIPTEEGAEFILDDRERWLSVNPNYGEIVEVFVAGTDHLSASALWAGFLVMETQVEASGSCLCRVKFLGVPDAELSKEFSNKFNRRTGKLHLCRTRPCSESVEESTLHVTHLRWWSQEGFHADYMTPAVRRQMKKWLDSERKEPVPSRPEKSLDKEWLLEEESAPPRRRLPTRVPLSSTFAHSRRGSRSRCPKSRTRATARSGGEERSTEDPLGCSEGKAGTRSRAYLLETSRSTEARWYWKRTQRRTIIQTGGKDGNEHGLRTGSPKWGPKGRSGASGFKRSYYETLSRPCRGSAGASHGQLLDEEEGTEEEEEKEGPCGKTGLTVSRCLQAEEEERKEDQGWRRWRPPGWERLRSGEQWQWLAGQEEEETESDDSSRWDPTFLQQQLQQRLCQRGGFYDHRPGCPTEEEVPQTTREHIGDVGESREESTLSRQPARCRSGSRGSHPGSEDNYLFLTPREDLIPYGDTGAPGDVHAQPSVGYSPRWRCSGSIGPVGRTLRSASPGTPGRRLGSSSPHGAVPLGGGQCSQSGTCVGNSPPFKALPTHARARLRLRWRLWLRARQGTPAMVWMGKRKRQGRQWRQRKRERKQRQRQEWRSERKRQEPELSGECLGCKPRESRGQASSQVAEDGQNSGTVDDSMLLETEKGSQYHQPVMHEPFISRAASLAKAVRVAPEDDIRYPASVGLHELITLSTSLDALGVCCAWYLVQSTEGGGTVHAAALICNSVFATKPERQPLPIPLGELASFVKNLKSTTFEALQSPEIVEKLAEEAWLLLCIYGVNALHSAARMPRREPWLSHHKRAVASLREHVVRFRKGARGCEICMSPDEWERELRAKRVNYSGEEMLQCHPLTLKQILPSLPPTEHGGCVPAIDWVGNMTRFFLLNPRSFVVDDVGQELPSLQGKIHIPQHELEPVVAELVKRNICGWVPLQHVLHYRGQPVLNGMFGVEKPSKLEDNSPVLRVIMNLVPSNSVLRQLSGGTASLPYIGQWLSVVLEGDQQLKIWQSDMSAAFYLFALPEPWWGNLCFNVIKPGYQLGLPSNQLFALGCKVIPMGFNSSVALMQEISENLLRRSALPLQARVSRGSQLPLWLTGVLEEGAGSDRAWYHIYLDNFCAGARVAPPDFGEQGDYFHGLAERAWKSAGVVSSEKKRKAAVDEACELGCLISGELGTMGISPDRALRLGLATLHLLGRNLMNRKMAQVVAGRWVHAFQFRRPMMAAIDVAWAYIGRSSSRKYTFSEIKREFFRALAMLPLAHSNLRAKVADFVTASDASETGGAVGISRELTTEGKDFVDASCKAAKGVIDIPVLVISLFNGIGGALRCYDILGLRPKGVIIVEILKEANRVSMRRWPHAILLEDVTKITRETVRNWCTQFSGIEEVHLWAGFPCKDLSSAKHGRKNLAGDQSSLFYEVPRIKTLLSQEFPSTCRVKFTLENVASMDRKASEEISHEMGVNPYYLDCADFVPIHRPRLCWSSEDWMDIIPGITFTKELYWTRVWTPAPWPDDSQWIAEGWQWNGAGSGLALPTAMRTVAKTVPPPHPAGLERTPNDARQRWAADDYRLPPYQYKWQFLMSQPSTGKWRRPNAAEKELLMGYGFDHTSLCMSASNIKKSKILYEDTRQSLIGDAFAVGSFLVAAAGLCRGFTVFPAFSHLVERLGLAPGFCAQVCDRAPISRTLSYGGMPADVGGPHLLNRLLLTKTNHTGSDVRISTGAIINPRAFPRQGVEASWWNWIPVFRTRWLSKEHINLLELRATFLAVKHSISHLRAFDIRLFHLADSYVTISVVAKGRTSAFKLQRILRQLNAYLLSYGIHLVMCHVESTTNPTDHASRST